MPYLELMPCLLRRSVRARMVFFRLPSLKWSQNTQGVPVCVFWKWGWGEACSREYVWFVGAQLHTRAWVEGDWA